jgi:hypothetical protein
MMTHRSNQYNMFEKWVTYLVVRLLAVYDLTDIDLNEQVLFDVDRYYTIENSKNEFDTCRFFFLLSLFVRFTLLVVD